MNLRKTVSSLLTMLLLTANTALSAEKPLTLATPNPSKEAVDLYNYLISISGNHTLAGQHCVPLTGSLRLAGVDKAVNHYPAVFGQDFGFSEPGTWDGINYRNS